MEDFKTRLNKALEVRDITPAELARATGINEGGISQYRKGSYKASQRNLDKMARALNVSIAWLMGADVPMEREVANGTDDDIYKYKNIIPMPKMREIPLIGTIACGTPILAQGNIEEYIKVPEHIDADFGLRCKGDSMINARIHDGDIVYIRQQPMVENGEIAAVLIDEETTLKRVFYYPEKGKIILKPESPTHEPLVYMGEELSEIHIMGKAVAFTSRVR